MGGLVLGCIEADLCKHMLVWENFRRDLQISLRSSGLKSHPLRKDPRHTSNKQRTASSGGIASAVPLTALSTAFSERYIFRQTTNEGREGQLSAYIPTFF